MSDRGKYIYGIINSNTERCNGSFGKENKKRPFQLLSKEVGRSLRSGDGVYFVPYKDISAVVSNEEIVDYSYMLKDALARLLVSHQRVIEGIMDLGYEIIPMRLGTFTIDEDDVENVLSKGYCLIKNIFNKVHDKIEIDVVSTWSDFDSILKEAGEEKEIREFKERLLWKPEGITVDDQMKAGMMLKKALDNRREKCVFKIQSALQSVSHDIRLHELMNDNMVINSAFLVNKSRLKEFDRKIESLNDEFVGKLDFKRVGPLPPYSFFTLEIEKIQFDDVNWAKNKLCIPDDETSKNEIKKAYKRLAFSCHPDRNPDSPGIEKEFNEIKKAYKLLIDYGEASEQTGRAGICSFKEEEFIKNAVLVRVRE